jgi:hypothetical protein
MNDSLSRLLGELPQAQPDRARSARLRSRCHTMLADQRAQAVRQTMPPGLRHSAVGLRRASPWQWEAVVLGIGCLYFAGVIREALQVYGAW